MTEIDFLQSPRVNRPLAERAEAKKAHPEMLGVSRRFAKEYFDGDRLWGYGGYHYDGRWRAVAERMRQYYRLAPGHTVLDVGCAKGFLLHDLAEAVPGLMIAGVDISEYALEHAMPDVKPFLQVANARKLPFADKSVDLVISINTVHNLPFDECCRAIEEMKRVSRAHKFLQVDAWRTEEERAALKAWGLTCQTVMSINSWRRVLGRLDYTGDCYWTILEVS